MTWYGELLKNPRWQRRRLEVLGEKDFTCEECSSKEKTLHVHHMYYERGKKPWEYPKESLRVLCEDCHELMGQKLVEFHQSVCTMNLGLLDLAIGAVRACAMLGRDDWKLDDGHQVLGASLLLGTTPSELATAKDADGFYPAKVIQERFLPAIQQRMAGEVIGE